MLFSSRRPKRGLTLIELLVVLIITMLFATIGLKLSGEVLRQNRLMNQVRWVKSAFVTARARAIERSAPVRFTYDHTANSILIELDQGRTGTFPSSSIDVIMPETDSPFSRINPGKPMSVPTLADWSGGSIVDFSTASALQLFIFPDGRVQAGNPLGPANGTIYFSIDTSSEATAAVQFSSLGLVRLAFCGGRIKGGSNWKPWEWVE